MPQAEEEQSSREPFLNHYASNYVIPCFRSEKQTYLRERITQLKKEGFGIDSTYTDVNGVAHEAITEDRVQEITELCRGEWSTSEANSVPLMLQAAHLSHFAHGTNPKVEKRGRLSGEPYFEHPKRMTEAAVESNMNTLTRVAILLHDVVEDTPITLQDIEVLFGIDTKRILGYLTKARVENMGHVSICAVTKLLSEYGFSDECAKIKEHVDIDVERDDKDIWRFDHLPEAAQVQVQTTLEQIIRAEESIDTEQSLHIRQREVEETLTLYNLLSCVMSPYENDLSALIIKPLDVADNSSDFASAHHPEKAEYKAAIAYYYHWLARLTGDHITSERIMANIKSLLKEDSSCHCSYTPEEFTQAQELLETHLSQISFDMSSNEIWRGIQNAHYRAPQYALGFDSIAEMKKFRVALNQYIQIRLTDEEVYTDRIVFDTGRSTMTISRGNQPGVFLKVYAHLGNTIQRFTVNPPRRRKTLERLITEKEYLKELFNRSGKERFFGSMQPTL